jgi:hypothetical protein
MLQSWRWFLGQMTSLTPSSRDGISSNLPSVALAEGNLMEWSAAFIRQ